jgi:ribosome-binding protein aMBF1 (putative translation factor)
VPKTKDAIEILDRLTGDDEELRDLIEKETINSAIAALIYRARTAAGLTQKQLADLVGAKQPNIARLEDADYQGHSLSMLQRIAESLNQRLDISFKPIQQSRKAG